jgi:hypothetical protein
VDAFGVRISNVRVGRGFCRTPAGLSLCYRPFPQSPFVLMVQFTLMVLFELVLAGKVLETNGRHGPLDTLGAGKLGS